ncbi:MAG: UDP-3-O-(3-hydroxymyristoyl)glucosamine N-acyltransferase [Candidatus Omnitrophica bacterium]|nr:UDP-3-O-(3-hydroxymyristoyl)glucosamine N-acyltransferase [Candidatus Omnitrophota bacterium]
MEITLKEIADFVGGKLLGDGDLVVRRVAGIKEARSGDITFLANSKYISLLLQTQASAIIVRPDITEALKPVIQVDNPSEAFTKIVERFYPQEKKHPQGIHPSAVVAPSAKIEEGVAIGAYSVIEEAAVIGKDSIIYSGCFIGRHTEIGCNCLIYPSVCIREDTSVGNRVVIQSGTVIGSDGFGFLTKNGIHRRIPQIGVVVIEDDVEIGANVAIDRARFDKTVIGKGTKIDNLVHIAHNVVIGKNCFIVAQVGISGSTTIGDNVTLAGQVGLVGHVNVGDGAVVMAKSGISKSVAPGEIVWGIPARAHMQAKRINASLAKLPELLKTVAELKQKLKEGKKRKDGKAEDNK